MSFLTSALRVARSFRADDVTNAAEPAAAAVYEGAGVPGIIERA